LIVKAFRARKENIYSKFKQLNKLNDSPSYILVLILVMQLKNLFLSPVSRWQLLSLILILQLTLNLMFYSQSLGFLATGPNHEIAHGTKTIVETGKLESAEHRKSFDYLQTLSKDSGNSYWQDMFALSKDNKLIPAHSLFTSVVLIPFYFIFGNFGFWIFNQICFLSSICALFSIFKFYTNSLPSLFHVFVIFLTPLTFHIYSLSYDLFGTALIISGIALGLKNCHILTGILVGLAVFIRPSNALYAVLLLPLNKVMFKNRLQRLLAFSLILLSYFYVNYYFFGSAFISSRERMPYFDGSAITFYTPELKLSTFTANWQNKLFSPHAGLITYAPSLLMVPIVYLIAIFNKRKNKHLSQIMFMHNLTLLTFVIQAIIIFSFHCWSCSNFGNRYLMPITMLAIIESLAIMDLYIKNNSNN
jgi:hypothetical protein